jgi:trimethylamine:corrinoid methyltransferase-like protein
MRAILDGYAAQLRRRLDAPAFEAAWRTGLQLKDSQALETAMAAAR